ACFFWVQLACCGDLLAGRTVHVGVYQNHPQVFTDAHGTAQGFYIDLLEFVAAREGWTLKMVTGTWTQGMERLKSGEIDLLTAVAFAPESQRTLDFNRETLLANWGQLYVADARIQSMLDLEEKNVVGLENDRITQQFEGLLKQFGVHYQLISVRDYAQAMESLVAGKADVAIVPKIFGMMNDYKYQVLRSTIVCCPVEMRFATAKGVNNALLEILDHYLQALKRDKGSLYYQSMNRWFGMIEREVLPVWVIWMLGGSGVLLVVGVTGLYLLKRRVGTQSATLHQEITMRKEMEAQLKRTSRELEANARELRDAKEVAEAANRAKSQFLTNMGHEIRTPMNAIQGMTEMALQTAIPPKSRELLGHVITASRSLMRIIDSILAFTKLDRGQETLNVEPFDLLDEVLAHVMDFASSSAVTKGVDLSFALDPGTPKLLVGDREKLEKILIYLLDNALKFTNKGMVTIRVSLRERHGERVRLEFAVRDTGVGVEPEQVLRIFEPFVQGDATLTRRHGGAGMGLAVCKRLVELMGGRIWVESVVDQGSVFCFTALFKIRMFGQEEEASKPLELHSHSVPVVPMVASSVASSTVTVEETGVTTAEVIDASTNPVQLGRQHQAKLQQLAHYLDHGDS
ncbi:MAG: ATP-binding protein, partial [Magnetococcus sp. YQC-5]